MVKYWHTLAGSAGTLWPVADRVRPVSYMDKTGVWEKAFHALIARDLVDETTIMLDSTTVKVHQHGSGSKKGAAMRKRDAAGEG